MIFDAKKGDLVIMKLGAGKASNETIAICLDPDSMWHAMILLTTDGMINEWIEFCDLVE